MIKIILTLVAIYCIAMYLLCAYRVFRYREEYESETFHLGLCFVLAIGFLGLMGYYT